MSWLGRNVIWVDARLEPHAGIVCMDNHTMNEVLVTIFRPWNVSETVRGHKQDGPWDPLYRDCWLAEKNYGPNNHGEECLP